MRSVEWREERLSLGQWSAVCMTHSLGAVAERFDEDGEGGVMGERVNADRVHDLRVLQL